MNKKQTVVMWIGVVIFVFFDLILAMTMLTDEYAARGPLIILLMNTVIITVAMIYTLRDKKQRGDKK
jgi:hypothetical protein